MDFEVLESEELVAQRAAAFIAAQAQAAVNAHGRFDFAVSGGHTPWLMLRQLATMPVPWPQVRLLQVDERIAPAGDRDRNLTHLRESLLELAPLASDQVLAMPVEAADLNDAARQYSAEINHELGTPAFLDLVHLGLGPDGHTASLVPGDPVLDVTDRDVAITGLYQGRRRMTLTYPIINRSRRILWVVTGKTKPVAFAQLKAGDRLVPAGRISRDQALVIADRAAAGGGR